MNIYDQLKQLWARVTGIEKSNASLAPLIPKIPKDLSDLPVDTGITYNGNKLYKVYFSVLCEAEGTLVAGNIGAGKTPIVMIGLNNVPADNIFTPQSNLRYNYNTGTVYFPNITATGVGRTYTVYIEYFENPAATREPDDEPETKATKAKKKATK